MTQETRIAVFRPDDERLSEAVDLLESLGADAVPDPMLAVEPTGARPREDADFTVLTSKTGVELAREAGWHPSGTVCAIGDRTGRALREAGYEVDLIPEEFSSSGLVRALEGEVAGACVEVARSDHGSPVLTDGLNEAGAYVHETVLYELVRPPESGVSVERAAAGELEGALFTSSLTVEHFLAAADERGLREEAVDGLSTSIVGAIGAPTRETAARKGIAVDVVPDAASFEELACAVVERAAPSYRD
ncbi:uroporphyrinogen-III synthase [Halalkalicoccus jeotgali]|uniref:Uroporphyrinogen-III synthase n=1 Tax=Halalkalicoccus jeotgali (strain DSM 18796 / CECT 7217 / JCM 14584 / KCTC 4019 / B3) TaxID=795797 RepID=D8J4D9_HALJB|nr:uroporphyrinogen-III synthase [Halalkalicoccus jeotgali]ADJ13501.1 uroporphyrinogen-III synthase [Halalkalicoccus jeotgali B3]ELY33024.1 uroporphyrinogen-III synthase [Halalkalicoccus jeotgali B3]